MKRRLFTVLSALSLLLLLLLCVSCSHRNVPEMSQKSGAAVARPATAPTSVLELWLGTGEPAARPLGEVLFAAAAYREHHGTWPPSPADAAAFAARHDLPMDAGAFESLTFEFEPDEEGGRFAIHFALKAERRTKGAWFSHGALRVRWDEATRALRRDADG